MDVSDILWWKQNPLMALVTLLGAALSFARISAIKCLLDQSSCRVNRPMSTTSPSPNTPNGSARPWDGVTLLFVRAAISQAPRASVDEEQDPPDAVAASN